MRNKPDNGKAILAFITEFIEKENRPPTFREVQEGLGFDSPNAITYHVKIFREMGLLKSGRKLDVA